MIKGRRDPYKLRRLRQVVQTAFLVVFALLLVNALFGKVLGSWIPLLVLTLTTVILMLVLGAGALMGSGLMGGTGGGSIEGCYSRFLRWASDSACSDRE